MANIGDLFFTLGLDDSKLIPDATKSGQAAGEAAGQSATKSLGSKVGAGLKTSFMGFGVAASGAFALATKGALELENVQVDLQRETGLSADEAKRAASAINGIAGRNVQDIGAVSAAFAKVHNDLGLTGDAAVKATEQFVKFGRATGQDAASAVSAFDDILDGFGLTAEDAAGIMDKLVVSHQKYGGSIEENQAALSKMAPQLKALNLNLDDGVGLLNLFAASGLDAATGQKALNQAISKLPPGETIDQFLERLSKVQDDGQRAQLAISVFGAKAGAGLANAIKPGVSSLKDFEVSAADAAGATDKAADVIDSSFSGRIRKAMSIASAGLREFGQQFGPALTGIASLGSLAGAVFPGLGPKIAGGLAGALKGLGSKFAQLLGVELGSKAVAGAASEAVASAVTASTAESSAAGAAAKLGGTNLGRLLGLGMSIGLALGAAAIADQIHNTTENLGVQIHDALKLPKIDFNPSELPWPIGNKGAPDWAKFSQDAAEGGDKIAAALNDSLSHIDKSFDRAGEGANALSRGIAAEAPKAKAAGTAVGTATGNGISVGVSRGLRGAVAAAAQGGKDTLTAYAKGILDKQSVVDAAFQALTNQAKTELTRTQEIAHLVGILTSTELAKGLNDKRPGVQAAAEATRQAALSRLQELHANAGTIGKGAGDALSKALRSKNPAVRAAARELKRTIETNTPPKTAPIGAKGGTDLANALKSKNPAVRNAALVLKRAIEANTKANTKPRGAAAGGDLASALKSKNPTVRAAAVALKRTIEANTKANTLPKGAAAGRDVGRGLNSGQARTAIRNAASSLIRFINSLLHVSPQVTVRATVTRRPTSNRGGAGVRQHGGPVAASSPYIVGEVGPELFVPRVSGRIIPHGQTEQILNRGGDTYTTTVNVNSPVPERTGVDVARELRIAQRLGGRWRMAKAV